MITLFQTARRFNMPVQPQLVLLQKTLVNIEGLGRKLYPELDLWDTAHPFLEKWIRRRYHPKTIFKEIKRQAPEWLEKLPELPNLSVETLENIKILAETAPSIQASHEAMLSNNKRSWFKQVLKVVGIVCFTAAFVNYSNAGQQASWLTVFLIFAGLTSLIAI